MIYHVVTFRGIPDKPGPSKPPKCNNLLLIVAQSLYCTPQNVKLGITVQPFDKETKKHIVYHYEWVYSVIENVLFETVLERGFVIKHCYTFWFFEFVDPIILRQMTLITLMI